VTISFQLSSLDAVAWLKSLPAGSVNLVITDPPYESLETGTPAAFPPKPTAPGLDCG